MTKSGRRLVVLAVAVAMPIIAATAWFVPGKAADVEVTQRPGAMKRIATVTTEAIQFCGGNLAFLQYLSHGAPLLLEPIRRLNQTAGMPPLVSPRACFSTGMEGNPSDRQRAPYLFFVDESGGEGSGYDRLYADRNADGRFDPEESVGLMTDPPAGAILPTPAKTRLLVFEPFDLQVALNDPPRRVVARIEVVADGSARYLLVSEPLRRANVTLGGVECSVFLQSRFPGDYDSQGARGLIQYGPAGLVDFWRGNLCSINGSIYRLSAAPRGETLAVEEYVADAGTICLGLDGPWKGVTVKQITLVDAHNVLMAVGPQLEKEGELRAPAGRYSPVEISLAKGAATDVLLVRTPSANEAYGVRVSRDARSRLELAAKPEVTFTKPSSDARIRPGDELEVAALMEWPDWQLCVRSVSAGSKEPEPQVAVKDSTGNVVAQGPMPFG